MERFAEHPVERLVMTNTDGGNTVMGCALILNF